MTQADLFASPDAAPFIRRARIENPKSSHDAAEAIEETAESQCIRILALVKKWPDRTTQELHELSRWGVHTLGRRLPELRQKGLVTNPVYPDPQGVGPGMRLRRCAIKNRLALTWRAV
jgi:hypothetical protein